jgi:hypothetical protein
MPFARGGTRGLDNAPRKFSECPDCGRKGLYQTVPDVIKRTFRYGRWFSPAGSRPPGRCLVWQG